MNRFLTEEQRGDLLALHLEISKRTDADMDRAKSIGFSSFLIYLLFCALFLSACPPSPSTVPPTPPIDDKDIIHYCERILDMSESERQIFLSSKEGGLFKKKYEEAGYKYDERDIQDFCKDRKKGTTHSYRSSGRSSRRRSSSRSPRPCPDNGVFPPEDRQVSYIRFEGSANRYTKYIHKKYRSQTAHDTGDIGEAEDESGNAHSQDILLRSFIINNVFALFLDKELIEYETGETYYLYLSESEANNGERESRRLTLNPGKEYTNYYWPPVCDDNPANSEKCECQNPDQADCLPGKPEDPDWNRDAVSSIKGLPSDILDIFSTVTFQVFSSEIDSNSIDDYFQDQRQIVHVTSEKGGNCKYYQHEEP